MSALEVSSFHKIALYKLRCTGFRLRPKSGGFSKSGKNPAPAEYVPEPGFRLELQKRT